MIKIFIADSYGSNKLAHLFTQLFGNKVEIFCDPNYSPKYSFLDVSFEETAKSSRESEEKAGGFINQTSKDNFDLFFLSAKIITQGDLRPNQLKNRFGTSRAKVIAISSVSNFLNQAVESYGADYGLNKSRIMYAESPDDLESDDRELIESFLRDDFFNRVHPVEGSKLMKNIIFESQKIERNFRNQKDVDFSVFDKLIDELAQLKNKTE